jgi:curli biogenesis system outer membrane secretion channel CsgG
MRYDPYSGGRRVIIGGVVGVVAVSFLGCATTPGGSGVGSAEKPAMAAMATPVSTTPPPSYDGLKKRLAVIRLENKVKTPLPDASWQIGEGLTEMLTTELYRTGRFIMVERSALADIVKEQELGQTGLVQKETATKVGELLGAQLLVAGAVTEFESSTSGGGAGVGVMGLALAMRTNNAHVGVDIRLVDSTTGQIVKSYYADAKANESALGLAGNVRGIRFGSDAFLKTPLGQATREAIAKAVAFIISEMNAVAWIGRVVQIKGDEVYVNAGTNMNLKSGQSLEAYTKGDELRDPATGLSLGSKDERVGTVTLTQIEDKFSIGTFAGNGTLKRGDLLKLP